MKTIVIWDSCGETSISFFELEGDFGYLDGTYLNAVGDKTKQDELNAILAYDVHGKPLLKMLDKFPLPADVGDAVIVCGFLP